MRVNIAIDGSLIQPLVHYYRAKGVAGAFKTFECHLLINGPHVMASIVGSAKHATVADSL